MPQLSLVFAMSLVLVLDILNKIILQKPVPVVSDFTHSPNPFSIGISCPGRTYPGRTIPNWVQKFLSLISTQHTFDNDFTFWHYLFITKPLSLYLLIGFDDLNITVRPSVKYPELSKHEKRWETYKSYPPNNPVPAKELCEAGFFYEGQGHSVKCFWCDGAIKEWGRGDNPWTAHAK